MTEAEKDLKAIKFKLLDKAYPDYFLHKKMTVTCPKCKKIVEVYEVGNDKITDIIVKNADQIKEEVLAQKIIIGSMQGHTAEWKINGEDVTFGVAKVSF